MKKPIRTPFIIQPSRVAALAWLSIVVCAAVARAQTTLPVYAMDDASVLNPGPGNSSYSDAASRNFGGLNSRSVASPTAHPGNNPANPAKGEFDSVLRFDLSSTVASLNASYGVGGWSIAALSLTLNTSSSVGNNLFNSPGASGSFNVSWMSSDGGWTQGAGSTASPTYTGITFNSLQSTLSAAPATWLSTCSFVAQGTLAPATYTLSTANAAFLSALASGNALTLLLTPADDHVAFNFTSHSYNNGSTPSLYSPTLSLTVVPEPTFAALASTGFLLVALSKRRR